MKNKKVPFLAYRYLVTAKSNQLTLIQETSLSKEELFKNIVNEIINAPKIDFIKGSKRYLFIGKQSNSNIHIVKLARESNEIIHVEGETDIEEKGIKEAKYIVLIIDTEHQIVLVENKKSTFQYITTSVNIIEDYFREKMLAYDYIVNMYPLASKNKFWSYIKEASAIFELTLEMNAPNMPFFGDSDTREILSILRDDTNNETLSISIKNKDGKLKIVKEFFGKYIDYVREVGGKYFLKFSRNGSIETTKSDDDTYITYLSKIEDENYVEEDLGKIADKLTSIHKLETREDETE
jgi:hypothetical protein